MTAEERQALRAAIDEKRRQALPPVCARKGCPEPLQFPRRRFCSERCRRNHWRFETPQGRAYRNNLKKQTRRQKAAA